ncbi:maltose-binding periplasmic protein [Marinitoga piezophila KA3]|uniref:Maltose-binding periplasmic protein n=1 Tax=Marinitoga piezophila (strain DSM 14283 / JCM 11233 / KA3) TaxID=443254 RepID=H2J447_MARPK|nr:extracellular solute-binding protein [Marinitoga piezophila]AEX85862.1 maltose-binding periplasmic protein [Marinitoga piezophila KA3]
MKRFSVLILFVLMITFLFAGEITVWFEYEGFDQFEDIVKSFEKENPGITVKVIRQQKISSKLFTVFRGDGDIPDIVLVKNDEIGKLTDAGLLENIDALKDKYGKSFIKGSFDAFKIEKHIVKDGKSISKEVHYYGIPFYFDTQVLFYHYKTFYDAGFPLEYGHTFEDLLFASYAVEEKTKGKTLGLAWGANSPYWFPPFQWAFGKENLMENGRIIIDDDNTYNAISFIFTTVAGGSAHLIERQGLVSGFKKGKIAAMFFGTFMIPDFIKSGIEFKILPLPYIKEAGNYMTPVLDYKGFSVIKGKLNNDVEKFLEYISKKESQITFCKDLYKFPSSKSAFDELKEKDEYFKVAYMSAERGKVLPNSAYFKSKYWQGIRTMMTLILKQKDEMDDSIIEKTQRFMDEK